VQRPLRRSLVRTSRCAAGVRRRLTIAEQRSLYFRSDAWFQQACRPGLSGGRHVKRHIERVLWDAGWSDAGQSWAGKDGQLRLSGWQQSRRIVVLRRPLEGEALVAQGDDA
jgi:hypothetical protein